MVFSSSTIEHATTAASSITSSVLVAKVIATLAARSVPNHVRDRRVLACQNTPTHTYTQTHTRKRTVLPALRNITTATSIKSDFVDQHALLPATTRRRSSDDTHSAQLVDPRSRDMNTMQLSVRLTRRMQAQSPTLVPFCEGCFQTCYLR